MGDARCQTSDMGDYWARLRSAAPAEALAAFGWFTAGRDSIVAARGTALRRKDLELPVIDRTGRAMEKRGVLLDAGLEALGVEVITVRPKAGAAAAGLDGRYADVGALVCRAGLMMSCLIRAQRHLEGRESAGLPTLQLPLVKATFSECASLADRIRREAGRHLEGGPVMDLAADHAAISIATARAAKLMGGHGYLAGGINAIESLSLLIAAGWVPRASETRTE